MIAELLALDKSYDRLETIMFMMFEVIIIVIEFGTFLLFCLGSAEL